MVTKKDEPKRETVMEVCQASPCVTREFLTCRHVEGPRSRPALSSVTLVVSSHFLATSYVSKRGKTRFVRSLDKASVRAGKRQSQSGARWSVSRVVHGNIKQRRVGNKKANELRESIKATYFWEKPKKRGCAKVSCVGSVQSHARRYHCHSSGDTAAIEAVVAAISAIRF